MAVSKTKAKFVDVARQLFAKKGLESTTMNDIALASGKGRRTLYTYFNNKDEIFLAVIEVELDLLSTRVTDAANSKMELEDKLVECIYAHLGAIKEVVGRNGSLRADFFRNIWMVERVRKHFDQKERDFIIRILKEGVSTGRFVVEDVPLVADVIHYCIKGMEVPYIYGRIGVGLNKDDTRIIVKRLIRRALRTDEMEY